MSLKAFVAVCRCPHVKGAARRVAFQLADAHNDERGDAFPGQRLMAAREGVSTKTIENGVRQLEESGFVTVKRRRGRGSVYYLNLDRMRALGVDASSDCQVPKLASVPKPSSVGKYSDRSSETEFGSPQKAGSFKSSSNRTNRRISLEVDRPDELHNGRTRNEWARDLCYFRQRLNEGNPQPFWMSTWGPKPNQVGCLAPQDLLLRFDFSERTVSGRLAGGPG